MERIDNLCFYLHDMFWTGLAKGKDSVRKSTDAEREKEDYDKKEKQRKIDVARYKYELGTHKHDEDTIEI